jgi:Transcription factor WhiB
MVRSTSDAANLACLAPRTPTQVVAVMLCDHCPVLTACRQTAEERDEGGGVWKSIEACDQDEEGGMTQPPDHYRVTIHLIESSTVELLRSTEPQRLKISISPAVLPAGPTQAGPYLPAARWAT